MCYIAVLCLCSPRNYCISWERACPYTALNKRRNDFTLKSTQKSLKHKAIPGMDGTHIYLGKTDFFMFLFSPCTSSLCCLSFPSVAQSCRWEGILVIQGDHSGSGTWVSKLPPYHPRGRGTHFMSSLHSVLSLTVFTKCWEEYNLIITTHKKIQMMDATPRIFAIERKPLKLNASLEKY